MDDPPAKATFADVVKHLTPDCAHLVVEWLQVAPRLVPAIRQRKAELKLTGANRHLFKPADLPDLSPEIRALLADWDRRAA